jgi:hypothetical protein
MAARSSARARVLLLAVGVTDGVLFDRIDCVLVSAVGEVETLGFPHRGLRVSIYHRLLNQGLDYKILDEWTTVVSGGRMGSPGSFGLERTNAQTRNFAKTARISASLRVRFTTATTAQCNTIKHYCCIGLGLDDRGQRACHRGVSWSVR